MIISEGVYELIILSLGALGFFACLRRGYCCLFGGGECYDKVNRARHFGRVHVVAAGAAVVGSGAADGNNSVEALTCGFLIGFRTDSASRHVATSIYVLYLQQK